MVNDPIGDLLIRIKNGYMARIDKIVCDYCKINERILEILKEAKFIGDFKVNKVDFKRAKKGKRKEFEIDLLYLGKKPALFGVVRISKPGVRIYEDKDGLRKYLSEVGLVIVSTAKGLMKLKDALGKCGGEVICRVW